MKKRSDNTHTTHYFPLVTHLVRCPTLKPVFHAKGEGARGIATRVGHARTLQLVKHVHHKFQRVLKEKEGGGGGGGRGMTM